MSSGRPPRGRPDAGAQGRGHGFALVVGLGLEL